MTQLNLSGTAASQFDDFLYAPIVEGGDGMVLSVLSALARLNVDPWDEAARLARLPYAVATQNLIQLIAALPNGLSEGLDAGAVARELVALLPRQGVARAHSTHPAALSGMTIFRGALTTSLVLCLVLIAISLARAMAGGPSQQATRVGALAPAATSSASPPAQTSVPAAGH